MVWLSSPFGAASTHTKALWCLMHWNMWFCGEKIDYSAFSLNRYVIHGNVVLWYGRIEINVHILVFQSHVSFQIDDSKEMAFFHSFLFKKSSLLYVLYMKMMKNLSQTICHVPYHHLVGVLEEEKLLIFLYFCFLFLVYRLQELYLKWKLRLPSRIDVTSFLAFSLEIVLLVYGWTLYRCIIYFIQFNSHNLWLSSPSHTIPSSNIMMSKTLYLRRTWWSVRWKF